MVYPTPYTECYQRFHKTHLSDRKIEKSWIIFDMSDSDGSQRRHSLGTKSPEDVESEHGNRGYQAVRSTQQVKSELMQHALEKIR